MFKNPPNKTNYRFQALHITIISDKPQNTGKAWPSEKCPARQAWEPFTQVHGFGPKECAPVVPGASYHPLHGPSQQLELPNSFVSSGCSGMHPMGKNRELCAHRFQSCSRGDQAVVFTPESKGRGVSWQFGANLRPVLLHL